MEPAVHHLGALLEAWEYCLTGLYVVISFNGESGTDIYTPLAWAVPGEALHVPDVAYDGVAGQHRDVVRQAAALPAPECRA